MKNTIIIIGILLISGVLLRGKIPHEKFDSDEWKNSDLNLEKNWSLRWDMMNSLRNNHDLVGMSKNEVIRLLGKPDDSSSEKENFMYYYLGYSHKGINTGSLTLKLNRQGEVINIKVWQG